MGTIYTTIRHHCHVIHDMNTSTFDVIETRFEPPYKYITINGKTRKYLI